MFKHNTRGSIRSALSRYLRPDVVDGIAREKPIPNSLQTNWLSCLLVQVRADTVEHLRRNLERSVPICLRNRGVIVDMMGPFHLVAFGMAVGENRGATREQIRHQHEATLQELSRELQDDVRIVSFEGEFTYGLIGAAERSDYTIFVPMFENCVRSLLDCHFGEANKLSVLS